MSTTSLEMPTKASKPTSLPFPKISVEVVRRVATSPNGVLAIVVTGLLAVVFWGYLRDVTHAWFKTESYIQHGVFVPLASLYLGWLTWKNNREKMALRPTFWPALILLPMAAAAALLVRAGLVTLDGGLLMGCIGCVIWMAMGGKWLIRMIPAIGFLVFGMTFWTEYMDQWTLPAQQVSGWFAFQLLQVVKMHPVSSPVDPSLITLPHYEMTVGAACSGLKLTLAVLTASTFIALVGKLGWWKNMILLAAVLPLAMLNNSLRIALVGVAGELKGREAGAWMHDYGAYGVMLIAFWLLYRLAVSLGWKI